MINRSLIRYPGRVRNVFRHEDDITSIYIDIEGLPRVEPGSFVMVWLPGYEEVPISPSLHRDDLLRITVKNRGETTKALSNLDPGTRVFIRGPLGNGFKIDPDRRYILIGGGYGASPLIYALHAINELGGEAVYVEGFKGARNGLFIDEARRLGFEATLYVEEGGYGKRGLATDALTDYSGIYDAILACGPMPMLKEIYGYSMEKAVDAQLSLESYVKCGVGICGSCTLGKGLLLCRDGPVFDIDELRRYELFG